MKSLPLICFALLIGCVTLPTCAKRTAQNRQDQRFAYIAKQQQQSFHDGIVNGIKKEMAKQHVEVDVFYAADQKDIDSQKQFLRTIAREKKYAGVMICPNSSSALIEEIQALDTAGIPYLFIDTALNETPETKGLVSNCGYVGTDNFLVGKMALQFIAEKIAKGNIVMMRGIHTHRSSIDREVGFMEELQHHTQFSVSSFLAGDWATDPAYHAFAQFMATNTTPIHAVFSYNDHMAIGISRYYEGHPTLPRPILVGVDGTVVGQRGLLEKRIDAIVVQATELMGIEGLKRIIRCAAVRPIEKKDVPTPVTIITTTTTMERSER